MSISDHIEHSDDVPNRNHRSEAQRAASRRNGAKSRGPRARSAAGVADKELLSKQIMPPEDHRELDVLYLRIRQELVEQFQPKSFTHQAAIDALAHDYLGLVRARRMVETAAAAGSQLTKDEEMQWRQLRDTQRDLAVMARLLELKGMPEGPMCGREEARHLARRVRGMLEGIQADIDEAAAAKAFPVDRPPISEPVPPDGCLQPPDGSEPVEVDLEAEDDARRQRLLDTLGDARKQYLDEQHVLAMLCGDRILTSEDWTRVRALLEVMTHYAKWHVNGNDSLLRRVTQLQRQNLQTLAAAPEALQQAEQYARDIERAIESKLARLRS